MQEPEHCPPALYVALTLVTCPKQHLGALQMTVLASQVQRRLAIGQSKVDVTFRLEQCAGDLLEMV